MRLDPPALNEDYSADDPFYVAPAEEAAPVAPERPRRSRWKTFKRVFLICFALLVLIIGWLAVTAPLNQSLRPIAAPSLTILSADGEPIARRGAVIGEPVSAAELLPLSAATFALSKLIVHEKVETWVRRPFVDEHPDGKRPKGRRLRYAVGELMSCTRCLGAWSALGLFGLRTLDPAAARTVTTVLAMSAANDFLHSSFSLLCRRANVEERRAQAPAPVTAPRTAA